MADATLAADFYTRFRSESQLLSQRITDISANNGQKEASREELMASLAKLRKELIDATPFLPSYDQRQSELQMKKLEQQLETAMQGSSGSASGSAKSGSKFSFKRTARPANTASTTQEVSSSTANPPGGDVNASTASTSAPAGTTGQGENNAPGPSVTKDEIKTSTRSNQALEFSNRSHEFITLPPKSTAEPNPSESQSVGTEISLSSLSDCIVDFTLAVDNTGVIRAFYARGLQRCIVVLPYVEGSALIHDCEDCLIAVGCHQFRIHTSTRIDVYLHVTSTPILEKCKAMRFASYDLQPDELPPDAKGKRNQYDQVRDFLWLRSAPSPNWSLIPAEEQVKDDWKQILRSGENVDETLKRLLPVRSGPVDSAVPA